MPGNLVTLESARIEGRWGRLRPLEVSRDAPGLYQLQHDEHEAATWGEMKVGPFADEAAFTSHVAEFVADPERAFFAVTDPSDTALGWFCLMEAKPAHRCIELGYVLFTPPLRRTTLATEAFFLAMTHVFDTLGYRRLEWTCTATNLPSRRAAERLGFTYEGTMRRKMILKGVTHDIAIYSMLIEEWPGQRDAIAGWLDPVNFEDGVQKTPLRT
jgi:RimJ/RimL family protein N-acetyltransferase